MKHVSALFIKFVMVLVVLELALLKLTNLTLIDILYISAVVTVVAYIIGDLLILPLSNNTVATIADTGLALVIIFMFNYLWNIREISFSDALSASLLLGVGEWFFHKYVAKEIFPNR